MSSKSTIKTSGSHLMRQVATELGISAPYLTMLLNGARGAGNRELVKKAKMAYGLALIRHGADIIESENECEQK